MNEIEIIKGFFRKVVGSFNPVNNIVPDLTDVEAQGLTSYLEILKLWNKKIDLVSPQSDEMLIGKHLIDSAVVSWFLRSRLNISLDYCYVDVGSGAGFPGAILGLFEPNRKVYLIEPREKRCAFLKEIKRRLKLSNVEVVCSRVEDVSLIGEKVGVVINRALGMRDKFLTKAEMLVDVSGYVVELLTPEVLKELLLSVDIITLSYLLPPDSAGRVVIASPAVFKVTGTS